MHIKMKEKIISILKEVITATVINNRNMTINDNVKNIHSLTQELNKRKDSYQLELVESFWIYADAMDFVLFETLTWKKNSIYNFCDHNIETINLISNHVLDYFIDIPNQYEVKICLPNILFPDTEKEKTLYLTREIITPKVKSLDFISIPSSKVVIKTNGYFFKFKKDIFLKDVLSKLNVMIFLMVENKILNLEFTKDIHQNLGFLPTSYQIPSINIEICSNKRNELLTTNLHYSISQYYSEILMLENTDQDLVLKSVALTNQIINDTSYEALRIKSAIDWYIQSTITNDTTMSFLQICIGLESIYGDDNSEGGLTNTLADRCSYLIGRDIKQRKYIKSRFLEIYRVRSKIVHGVNIKNTGDIVSLKNDALNYLKKSINQEITNMGWNI